MSAAVVGAIVAAPLLFFGLCFVGVLPNPFLSVFADILHYVNRKGRFAPKRKRHFNYNQIGDSNIFVGRQPTSVKDVEKLHIDNEITGIVCMNLPSELYVSAEKIEKKFGNSLQRLEIPVPDYQGATQRQLKDSVKWIDKHLKSEEGKNVFIHCNGGKGRSAGVAAAYFMYTQKNFDDYHEAVEYVRKGRPVTSSGLDRFPISSSSRSLFMFHTSIKKKGSNNQLLDGLKDYQKKHYNSLKMTKSLRDLKLPVTRSLRDLRIPGLAN